MRHFAALPLLLTISLTLLSCDPCSNLDCATDNYHGQFRIVDAISGTDLVFGASRVYDREQIRFYSLRGQDTIYFDYQAIRFPGRGYDSILYVHFFPRTDVAYMRLSNGDIDTLNMTFQTTDSRCCGTITMIKGVRYNNAIDMPGSDGTQVIKK